MSKGLEALEKICSQACKDRDLAFYLEHKNCKQVKENEKFAPYCNGCLYCSGNENYKIIEKELKALEIIKEKNVHITLIKNCENADQYNRGLLATMNKTTAKKHHLSDE